MIQVMKHYIKGTFKYYQLNFTFLEVAKCSELKPPLHGTVHQGEDTALFECLDGYRLRGSRTLHCNKSSLQWTAASNRFINPICYYTYGNRSHPTFKDDTEIALLHPTQVRGNSVSVYVIGLLIFLCTCLGFVCGLPITRKLVRRKLGGNNAANSNNCHQSKDRAEHIFQEVPPSNSTILHQTNSVVYRDLGFEGKTSPQSGRKRGEIVFEEDSLYIQMHPICNSGVRWWTVNDTN
ncbi:hypothetical protein HOLleu_23266 [Holothuria leucospilota]|uniref:Sushi domain-containing protein n=1 Tax=Holothuria leucospilota TaxID=206669 RepID=A0A9Q1BTY2_HOLLE|nr:hypothetical protein HOLleu_23266 [Holothuria leucospilota]